MTADDPLHCKMTKYILAQTGYKVEFRARCNCEASRFASSFSNDSFRCIRSRSSVDRATLNGTVTDSSGAIVLGAKIVATSTGTGLHREVLSGGSGT